MKNKLEPYSVLMSVYYKENPAHLRQSVESMLQQTVPPDDFVIVCDGPLTPELDKVLMEYTIQYPELIQLLPLKENVGLGQALNAGMELCKHSLITRMDSDDIAFPKRCEMQIKALTEHTADIVSGAIIEFVITPSDSTIIKNLPETHEKIATYAKRRCPFNHPAVLFRKEAVIVAGGYQPFYLFEDYFLWLRMLIEGCKGYNIQQPILYMRGGKEMYQRRGGIKYVRSMFKFRWWMKQTNYINWGIFLYCTVGHMFVMLMPNRLRGWIYKHLLRK